MRTIISYTLFFSRENNYLPFVVKDVAIYKGWELVHSHSATVSPECDLELKFLYEDFRSFQHEEADATEITFKCLDTCKTMTITKKWEG
jgi:hypothetical protein